MELKFNPKENVRVYDNLISYFLDNKIVENINGIFARKQLVKNWYEIPLFKFGIKKSINLKLRSGFLKHFQNYKEYLKFWRSEKGEKEFFKNIKKLNMKINSTFIEFTWNGKVIRMRYNSQKDFESEMLIIKEQFVYEQYNTLRIKNNVILDIGANVGDSAIYFYHKGAKHVYSFEPYPYTYKLGLENIKLNNLQNYVTFLNKGVGNKGKIKLDENYNSNLATGIRNFKNGVLIEIETLEKIIKQFKITNGIMKIDCEGSEYEFILNADIKSLRKFQQILIEYHYGYRNLVKKLESSGFKVKITRPINEVNNELKVPNLKRGLIICERI